jgi:hypothetical protein
MFLTKCFNTEQSHAWASTGTYLTLVIYILSTGSLVLNYVDNTVFNKFYYPLGMLVCLYGVYALKSKLLKFVFPFNIGYAIIYALFIYKSLTLTYFNLPGLKESLKKECISNYADYSDEECQNFASGQAKSVLFSTSIMLLAMGMFFYWITLYTWSLVNPVLPEYEKNV